MLFDTMNQLIPKTKNQGKIHTSTMYVSGGFGWSVRVKWPGKHRDSDGDFVVEVLSEGVWDDYHQFKHSDLFFDIRDKADLYSDLIHNQWVENLLGVAQGSTAPRKFYPLECDLPGVHLDALTNAMQALTVCEFRRYPQGDIRGGGRYLPVNYMLAMLQGYWTPDEAAKMMRVGFPALRKLDGFIPFTHTDSPEKYAADIHSPRVDTLRSPAIDVAG